ncbi:MAG TPA: membrane protein insertion efficiency factor YidD [Thermoanaerobaculia bacterium]|nr:membrane protein insertion efficiency factor YidD [Thermoanaerobaculia bacterium]
MEESRRRRLKGWGIVLAILLAVGLDLARAPRNQLSARVLIGAIDLYQATLSPRMGSVGVQCRFKPTCSHYGEGAIRKYGAWTGSWKAAWRIARCGPWTPAGTVDPP